MEKVAFEVDLNGGWGLTGLCVSVCRLPRQAGELGRGVQALQGQPEAVLMGLGMCGL